jgi:formimidoylglutamate deiminase
MPSSEFSQHHAARSYIADLALLGDRIASRVLIEIDPTGTISAVEPDSTARAERLAGLAVPGMTNLHSHAFQRAMAGLTERAGPEGDNFWRWREVMYRFLSVLTPEDVEAIAAQLYIECLQHGYTAIAEFHYLHNAADGTPYADPTELAQRIAAAAAHSGIDLTLLPVLYRHAQFGGAPVLPAQRRFVLSFDAYASLCQTMAVRVPVGVAPHSLRAVTPDELAAAIGLADTLGPDTPLHIHVAEQEKEVADCVAWSGVRPVQWLLQHAPVGPRWCLVHATHITPEESRLLASSGAVVGLCPTTEANLGDGFFPLPGWLSDGGRFGIGSDSNVSTSPVEELRWLEYVQRLQTHTRNVTETQAGASVGLGLYRRALAGGAQALGRRAGAIATGQIADLVVLDTDHPALVGRAGDALLDAWMFCGNATPVRDVMVAGTWQVRDGRHRRQDAIRADFARSMRRIAATIF